MSDKKSAFNNIKAQLSDGSTRIKYFGGIIICIVGSIVGYMVFKNAGTKSATVPSQVAPMPNNYQGANTANPQISPEYNKLLQSQNASAAAQASATGGSAVPVIRHTVDQGPIAQAQASAPVAQAVDKATLKQQEQAAAYKRYEDELAARQAEIATKSAAMKSQINLLVTAWQPQIHTTTAVRALASTSNTANARSATGSTENTQSTKATQTGRTVARAGDATFAQLNTAINTDEPGPIFATILQGSLKGAKLIGKTEVTTNAQKAGLHFNLMSIPGESSSISIDAWAIDPETARTAVGDADNHYLLRYSAMFASSFLSGFGAALLKGGQDQQLVSSTTGNVVQTNAYSMQQMMLNGVANVGNTMSSNMSSVINRPTTITVPSGIGIGIVFVADATVKKE
jgi:intracellular multiplication protein IcmE